MSKVSVKKIRGNQILNKLKYVCIEEREINNELKNVIWGFLEESKIRNSSYVVTYGTCVVGFVIVEPMIDSLFIHYLYVCSNARKRGYSKLLINKLKEDSQYNRKTIICFHNKDLQEFYIKQGFEYDDTLRVSMCSYVKNIRN